MKILSSILISAVLIHAALTLYYSYRHPRFDPNDATGLFWAESALQYHYAHQIAQGHDLPAIDKRAQYPEGLNLQQDLTIFMEYVIGYAYRLIGFGVPFHVFAVWWMAFFAALNVGVLGLLVYHLTGNRLATAVAVWFYALSPVAFARTVGNFLREDFALLFFFGGVLLLMLALSSSPHQRRYAAGAGVSFFILLSAWHFGQFAFLTVIAGLAGLHLLKPGALRLSTFLWIYGFALAAGLLMPPLRARWFALSLPMVISLSLIGTLIAHEKNLMSRRRWTILFPFDLAFWLLVASFFRKTEDYAHVTQLAWNKLRFFLQKPADPSLLPYHARILWLEPFNSPVVGEALYQFGLVLPLTLMALVLLIRNWRNLPTSQQGMIYLSLIYLVAAILIERMNVFAIFFFCGGIGLIVSQMGYTKRWQPVLWGVLIFALGFQSWVALNYDRPNPFRNWTTTLTPPRLEIPNYQADTRDMLRWIRTETPQTSVFLSRFAVGPSIYVYGNRAINLQPKFESVGIREKVRRFTEALYQSEADFYALCQAWGTTHFIYEAAFTLDRSPESVRYLADRLDLPLDSFAFQCHFADQTLTYFTPVYQNFYFKIFAVSPPDSIGSPPLLTQPLFDPNLFQIDWNRPFFDDSLTDDVIFRIHQATAHNNRGMQFRQQGHYQQALQEFQTAIQTLPTLPAPYFNLIQLFAEHRQTNQIPLVYQRLIRGHPDFVPFRIELGQFWLQQQQWEQALQAFQVAQALDPQNPYVQRQLRYIEAQRKGRSSAD
ncbi:MAG: hypothetical protein D6675_10260 [Gemmatimonadetes bacterium]|nr:MAG: hypothetical protein D6675_10260 [Gemmatimonadota bacterium]